MTTIKKVLNVSFIADYIDGLIRGEDITANELCQIVCVAATDVIKRHTNLTEKDVVEIFNSLRL